MSGRSTYILFIIGILPIIMVVGNSLFIPLLPQMQLDMGLTTVQGGWLLTGFSIPAALLVPVGGIVSDRIGRRKVALVALPIFMLGCVISMFAGMRASTISSEVFQLMMVGRILQGVGAGGVTPLAMAFISDIYEGEQKNRALGSIEVFNGVGKVISPIIGGFVLALSWSYSFVILLAISIFAFLGILSFHLPQSVKEGKALKKRKMMDIFQKQWRWIIPIFSCGAIGMFLLFGYLFYFAYLLETTTISSVLIGFLLAIPVLMLAIGSSLTAKKLVGNEEQYKKAIIIGFILMIIGSFLIIGFTIHVYLFLFCLMVFASGFGILLPAANAALASIVQKEERGTVFSLYSMLRFLGVALGPLFFGIWMIDIEQMAFTALFFISINGVIILYSWRCLPIGRECVATEMSRF